MSSQKSQIEKKSGRKPLSALSPEAHVQLTPPAHLKLIDSAGEESCRPQEPVTAGEGCDSSLAWWFQSETLHPRPNPDAKPKPPITLADMPAACRQVLVSP